MCGDLVLDTEGMKYNLSEDEITDICVVTLFSTQKGAQKEKHTEGGRSGSFVVTLCSPKKKRKDYHIELGRTGSPVLTLCSPKKGGKITTLRTGEMEVGW